MLVAIFMLSIFGVAIPTVLAENIIGDVYNDDSSYDRYFCHYWESTYDEPTNAQYDTCYLVASLPPYTIGEDCDVQARLFKSVYVDGDLIFNSMWIEGIYYEANLKVWVDSAENPYYDWYGVSFGFTYNLNWDSIFWGYDAFPNYWSPDDFVDMFGGWGGHTITVCFGVEWWKWDWYQWVKIGATEDMTQMTGAPTSHAETSNPLNYIICNDCTHFGVKVKWTDVYGTAYVINAGNGLGRTTDGYFAEVKATSYGATARIAYDLTSTDSGHVYIYGNSLNSPSSLVYVYCSPDNYNWYEASNQWVSNGNNRWIDFGDPGVSYRYVLAIAYDSGTDSWFKFDCINTGGHY